MTTLATDDFNRANGTLGANWTTVTGFNAFQIASNVVTQVTEPGDTGARYNAVTFPNDQWSQVTVDVSINSNGGPAVRMATDGSANYYVFVVAGGEYRIYSISGGSGSLISNAAGSFSNGDVAYLEIQGTTLIAKKNGVQVLTITDATHSAGAAGIHAYSIGSLDDWSAGDFAGGGGTINAATIIPQLNRRKTGRFF